MAESEANLISIDELSDQQSAQTACMLEIYRSIAAQVDNSKLKRATEQAIEAERNIPVDQIGETDASGILIDALPSLGKSYTAARTAAGIAEQLSSEDTASEEHIGVTILTHRVENREERKQDAEEAVAEQFNEQALSVRLLPSFTHDCESFAESVDQSTKTEIHKWYQRGLSPATLHSDPEFKAKLACDGQNCEFMQKRRELKESNPEVVIGHPRHAYQTDYIRNRIVFFDEDPRDAFRYDFKSETPGPNLHEAVHTYLSGSERIPADSHEDLVECRERDDRNDRYREVITEIKYSILNKSRKNRFENQSESELAAITGIGQTICQKLAERDIDSIEQLAEADPSELTQIDGIGHKTAAQAVEHAQARVNEDPEGIVKYEFDDVASDLRVEEFAYEYDGHALAPVAALAVLAKENDRGEISRTDLENGIHYVELPGRYEAVYDENHAVVYLRQPPDLSGARAVIGLDGTPIKRLWEGRLDLDLETRPALGGTDQREQYLTDIMGYQIVPMSEETRPYSSGSNLNVEICEAFLNVVNDLTAQKPAIITTKEAGKKLTKARCGDCDRRLGDEENYCPQCGTSAEEATQTFADLYRIKDDEPAIENYGNIRSSNAFKDIQTGAIIGSLHPGDEEIKRLAGLHQDIAERETKDNGQAATGADLSYGIADNPYLRYFRENEVTQAVFRFGREETVAATVFVFTAALPQWLQTTRPHPRIDELIRARKAAIQDEDFGAQFEVMRALAELEQATVTEIMSKQEVDIEWSTVAHHLKNLRDDGLVEKQEDKTWVDTGVGEIVNELDQWVQEIDNTGTVNSFEEVIYD